MASLEAALQALWNFQGPEVDVLKNALSRAKQAAQTRPLKEQLNDAFIQRSQKRIASLELGLVGQGSGSARMVKTGGGSSRTSSRRGPHARVEVEHGGVVPQGEGGPIGSGTNQSDAAKSLLLRLTKRKTRNCPEDNLRQINKIFTAIGVARCPRRPRHGISQFIDGTNFQRRRSHEQLCATVFGGAHGALIGA